MAVNKDPILKRCRSLGLEPSYLGINKESKRELKRANRKMSEYGRQLREKQKAKFIYGVMEKPFRNYYAKAAAMKGMTGTNLMVMLETRLDNILFRLGWARTRREARQMVSHGHFTVNGKKVNIASYLVKPGEVIALKETSRGIERFKASLEACMMRPKWLEFDQNAMAGKVLAYPVRDDIDFPVEEHLIVELYSK